MVSLTEAEEEAEEESCFWELPLLPPQDGSPRLKTLFKVGITPLEEAPVSLGWSWER